MYYEETLIKNVKIKAIISWAFILVAILMIILALGVLRRGYFLEVM